jgi:hypothetical protein
MFSPKVLCLPYGYFEPLAQHHVSSIQDHTNGVTTPRLTHPIDAATHHLYRSDTIYSTQWFFFHPSFRLMSGAGCHAAVVVTSRETKHVIVHLVETAR